MPLYLVRWPDLSAALVTATDEADLLDVLDEVANPAGCRWREYDGPLFLDFSLPVKVRLDVDDDGGRSLSDEAIVVENVERLSRHDGLDVSIEGDTGYDMQEQILRFAFPEVASLYFGGAGDVIDVDALTEAVRLDALPLIRAEWRGAQLDRSIDPLAKLARAVDAPVEIVRQWIERDKDDDE